MNWHETAPHNLDRITDRHGFRDVAVAHTTRDDSRDPMRLCGHELVIFYPDHWGLYDGAIDPGEDSTTALRRDLARAPSLSACPLRSFTRFELDCACSGASLRGWFYSDLTDPASDLHSLQPEEGRLMQPLPPDMLLNKRLVPYDSVAVWLHLASRRLAPGAEPEGDQRERDDP